MNLTGLTCHSFEHDGDKPTAAIMVTAPAWDEEQNCPMTGSHAIIAVWNGVSWQNYTRKWRGDPGRQLAHGAESWDFAPWNDPRELADIASLTERITSEANLQHEVAMKRIKSLELKLGKVAAKLERQDDVEEDAQLEAVGVTDSA